MTSEQRDRIAYDLSMGLWDDDEQQAAVSALLTAHGALQAQLAEARAEVADLKAEHRDYAVARDFADKCLAEAAHWQAEHGKAVEAIRAAHRASGKYEAWVPCPCEWCITPAPTGDGPQTPEGLCTACSATGYCSEHEPHTPASGEGEGR